MQNHNTASFAAIILAAGKATRFGSCKAAAMINGKSALEHCADSFSDAGVSDIVVVTGAWKDEVENIQLKIKCRYAHNSSFEKGMFSSVLAGINALRKDFDAVFINPVDIPLFSLATVQKLAQSFQSNSAYWHVPSFDGRNGHPVLIPKCYAQDLLNWDEEGGLRAFLNLRLKDKITVKADQIGILMDIDTPADLKKLNALSFYSK